MEPLRKRLVGETGVSVTQLGCGGSQLGSMFATVSDADARRTLEAAYDSGLRYFDTAPFYGRGLSEQRFGEFLRDQPRDSFVLSTKVGRVLFPADGPLSDPGTVGALPFEYRFDYSYDGVMRSHEDSLRRLGMEQVDLLLIHDLDAVMHGGRESLESHFAQLRDGGFRALDELRTAGAISGIGAGVNMAGRRADSSTRSTSTSSYSRCPTRSSIRRRWTTTCRIVRNAAHRSCSAHRSVQGS